MAAACCCGSASEAMTREELRRRLRAGPVIPAPGGAAWPQTGRQVEAAVLVPLVQRAGGLSLILTRRTDHLHHHAGQISFPGGRMEDSDDGPEGAALRETEEEIGIRPAAVEVLGCLPVFLTPSGFRITPVVGWVQAEACCRPDPFEVAEVFEVPLAFVLDPANFQAHRIEHGEVVRLVPAVPCRGRFIWGVTAGILQVLAGALGQG